MPCKEQNEAIADLVIAQATISDTKIVKIEILKSKPAGIFDDAVRDAIMQYRRQISDGGERMIRQKFEFTPE